MTNYILLEHYSANGGKLGISTKVFNALAEHSVKQIKDIKKDKNTIISSSIRNNTVNYKINVYVKKGTNKEAIKDNLEDKIRSLLLLTCETVPVEANIKVIEKEIIE